MLDRFAPTATDITLRLDLLIHPGGKLVLDNLNPVPMTARTGLNLPILAPRPIAFVADLLLFPLELGRASIVEIPQRDPDLHLDVLPTSLPRLRTEVPASAEEAAEEVERVVMLLSALLPLLEAFVAVLVVDAPGFRVDERLVGLRDFDKLIFCGVVTARTCQLRAKEQ
jgi:hypothetical protein